MGISTLYAWLQVHGFSYKKPKIIPKNVDQAAQEEFKERYHKIMKEAALEGNPVIFGELSTPKSTSTCILWVDQAWDKPIESTSARKRVNLMGILSLETMAFAYQDFETINGIAAVEFLKKVETAYPHVPKHPFNLGPCRLSYMQRGKRLLKNKSD